LVTQRPIVSKGYDLTFKIEKGVPPPKARGHTKPLKYPWDQMEVGESILVPITSQDQDERRRLYQTARCAAYSYGKRKKRKYETRVVAKGIRIWRTA
jgi:hypothetical protein